MLSRVRDHRFANRVLVSRAGLWLPEIDALAPRFRNVLAVLDGPRGRRLVASANIITDAGDVYYAQSALGEAPTDAFTTLYLSSVDWDATHPQKASTSDNIASVIAGASKAVDATYPRTADPDADNTGAGADVMTWRFSFAKADFNDADIDAGAIAAAGATGWGVAAGTDPLLTAFDIAPAFAKTADDTLKYIVNHTQNGV